MALTLGIDLACRAAHQATLARRRQDYLAGRKFCTRPADLEPLWADLDLRDPACCRVVEPTRNAWIVGRGVVPPPRRDSRDGPDHAVIGPAQVLLQAHQERPDRLRTLGAATAVASRGATGPFRARTGRSAAPADQAALHDGEASHRGLRPARCVHLAPRPRLVRGPQRPLRDRRVGVPGPLRRPARGDPARPGAPTRFLIARSRALARNLAAALIVAAKQTLALWTPGRRRDGLRRAGRRHRPSRPSRRCSSPTRSKRSMSGSRTSTPTPTRTASSPQHQASGRRSAR